MKILIVLCLGTLALAAAAPQKRKQIDFLYDDDETQASVQPVEINTVEPKVTASKISDPRQPAPVFEEHEDTQEEARSPIASALNLEQNEAENSEPSVQNDEAESELENGDGAKKTTSSGNAVADTTIRVYDEDEINGATERQQHEPEPEEQEKNGIREQQEEFNHELENKRDQEHTKINQKEEVNDDYQYNDEVLTGELKGDKPEQGTHEPKSDNLDPANEQVDNERQVTENENFQIENVEASSTSTMKPESHEFAGLINWESSQGNTVPKDDEGVELKGGQLFNHGTLILDKDIFEGQNINHPFAGPLPMKQWNMGENPDVDSWHFGPHGPHGPHGHRGHPVFPGTHGDHHRFEGPPPPWVQGPHFHSHRFDHQSHEQKRFNFHGNGFDRWHRHWGNPNSALPNKGSSAEVVNS